eukprot:jgi/Botrbrau1/6743/Bobra.0324s0028.1
MTGQVEDQGHQGHSRKRLRRSTEDLGAPTRDPCRAHACGSGAQKPPVKALQANRNSGNADGLLLGGLEVPPSMIPLHVVSKLILPPLPDSTLWTLAAVNSDVYFYAKESMGQRQAALISAVTEGNPWCTGKQLVKLGEIVQQLTSFIDPMTGQPFAAGNEEYFYTLRPEGHLKVKQQPRIDLSGVDINITTIMVPFPDAPNDDDDSDDEDEEDGGGGAAAAAVAVAAAADDDNDDSDDEDDDNDDAEDTAADDDDDDDDDDSDVDDDESESCDSDGSTDDEDEGAKQTVVHVVMRFKHGSMDYFQKKTPNGSVVMGGSSCRAHRCCDVKVLMGLFLALGGARQGEHVTLKVPVKRLSECAEVVVGSRSLKWNASDDPQAILPAKKKFAQMGPGPHSVTVWAAECKQCHWRHHCGQV